MNNNGPIEKKIMSGTNICIGFFVVVVVFAELVIRKWCRSTDKLGGQMNGMFWTVSAASSRHLQSAS